MNFKKAMAANRKRVVRLNLKMIIRKVKGGVK
jgi:hypothetical protein